jgi:hypothetical protein
MLDLVAERPHHLVEMIAALVLIDRGHLQALDLVAQRADQLVEMIAAPLRIDRGCLQALDLVAERPDQLVELGDLLGNGVAIRPCLRGLRDERALRRLRGLPTHVLDGVGNGADPLVEGIENVRSASGRHAALDPLGEPARVVGKRRERASPDATWPMTSRSDAIPARLLLQADRSCRPAAI